jgi:excisionase family DNA binding protein
MQRHCDYVLFVSNKMDINAPTNLADGSDIDKNVFPEYFTPQELAVILHVGARWVQKQIEARRLPGLTKVGRYWRIRKSDFEKRILTGEVLLPKLPKSPRIRHR